MNRPKFAASEIVDFLGFANYLPVEGVEVLRVFYCDALTAVRNAVTGQPVRLQGWVYEISCMKGLFVVESRLVKRANPCPPWHELMESWNNPKRAKA